MVFWDWLFFERSAEPNTHTGKAIMGFLGKLFYASNALSQYSKEKVSQMAMTAASLDLISFSLFVKFHFFVLLI